MLIFSEHGLLSDLVTKFPQWAWKVTVLLVEPIVVKVRVLSKDGCWTTFVQLNNDLRNYFAGVDSWYKFKGPRPASGISLYFSSSAREKDTLIFFQKL